MEAKAIRGVPWTFLAYAVNKGIRILSLMLLARLLAPSDFARRARPRLNAMFTPLIPSP